MEFLVITVLISVSPFFFTPAYQQDQLVQSGVIPRLVSIMRTYPENDPLVNVCLLALCNLADIGEYQVTRIIIVIHDNNLRSPDGVILSVYRHQFGSQDN